MNDRTAPPEAGATATRPRVVRTVVEIAAPPSRVFEALTDPEELAAWWGGDDARLVDARSEPWPGGAWSVRLVTRDAAEWSVEGEYRVVDEPRRLEQTWRADDEEGPSVVRYDLEPIELDGAEGTRLAVTHSRPATIAAAARASAGASDWAHGLSWLAARLRQPHRATVLA